MSLRNITLSGPPLCVFWSPHNLFTPLTPHFTPRTVCARPRDQRVPHRMTTQPPCTYSSLVAKGGLWEGGGTGPTALAMWSCACEPLGGALLHRPKCVVCVRACVRARAAEAGTAVWTALTLPQWLKRCEGTAPAYRQSEAAPHMW